MISLIAKYVTNTQLYVISVWTNTFLIRSWIDASLMTHARSKIANSAKTERYAMDASKTFGLTKPQTPALTQHARSLIVKSVRAKGRQSVTNVQKKDLFYSTTSASLQLARLDGNTISILISVRILYAKSQNV